MALMASDYETQHSCLLSNLDDVRSSVGIGLSTFGGDIATVCEQLKSLEMKLEEKDVKHSFLEENWKLWHVKSYLDDVPSSTNALQVQTSEDGLQVKTLEESPDSNFKERTLSLEDCKSHHASCIHNFNGMELVMGNKLNTLGHDTDDVNMRIKRLEKRLQSMSVA